MINKLLNILSNIKFFSHYKHFPIEQKLRKFVNSIWHIYIAAEYSFLSTHENCFDDNHNIINWNITWSLLRSVKGFKCTSMKRHKFFSFLLKLLHDGLPTVDLLKKKETPTLRQYQLPIM
jgi:hypothetical protein